MGEKDICVINSAVALGNLKRRRGQTKPVRNTNRTYVKSSLRVWVDQMCTSLFVDEARYTPFGDNASAYILPVEKLLLKVDVLVQESREMVTISEDIVTSTITIIRTRGDVP